ncbi:MAG: major capsid protein [Microviridae sp.]|nr:MAG: major capsid protein [Microviridae sp.]
MGQRKTLGGDRIGSGKKQKVDTTTFNRSTHDLGYIFRSTMSAGTLVPFMNEVVLTGDNINIDLGCEVLTLPTVGPLFGSMKVQLDVFTAPVRLYQGQLHNNKLGIGLNMAAVKLPFMYFEVPYKTEEELKNLIDNGDLDNSQINPSSILSYLGIRGFGIPNTDVVGGVKRYFHALGLLAYWDIVKNYYANKQEEDGWVIHTTPVTVVENVTELTINGVTVPFNSPSAPTPITVGDEIEMTTTAQQGDKTVMIGLLDQYGGTEYVLFEDIAAAIVRGALTTSGVYNNSLGTRQVTTWKYVDAIDGAIQIDLESFPLENIDKMREYLLTHTGPSAVDIQLADLAPYNLLVQATAFQRALMGSQEGLAVKTYQSDLFNNWLNTEYIDGVNGIAAVTAVSTVGDEFTIDSLILHKKVYEMLNDVMVSGGTYDDWNEVIYDHNTFTRAETPIYWGSLIKELQFQEVISNSQSEVGTDTQPLGTLAGRGRLGNKHKGGEVSVKVDEISMLIGIASITPRLDYSQGNEWHVSLQTMDDFHKPHLDEIGFQELITEQMAWWDTHFNSIGQTITRSAGKQPAWINYMTNVNRVKGNFAVNGQAGSGFMVLTRRYTPEVLTGDNETTIADLTTYIDPRHFNHIFAQTSLDAQNYWVQIGVDMTARRKISARQMPRL